jgi:hypothetical protein
MPDLKAKVKIYDPAIPFEKFEMDNPGIDTWHDYVLITKEAYDHISRVPIARQETLHVSGGMSMNVPLVEIGLEIGSIKMDSVEALIVDKGFHEILLGNNIFDLIFDVGVQESGVKVTSTSKDDPRSLAIELYPINPPAELLSIENIFRYQRRLHNIFLISNGEIPEPTSEDLNAVLDSDYRIPENMRLRLTWVDSGSIWITLASGSLKALKSLALLYEKGASASLAQRMADANKADNDAQISQATRDSVANKIKAEQDMLRAENIGKTYDAWRDGIRANLDFTDELISQMANKDLAEEMKTQKDEAIVEILKQKILPMVRNIPRPFEPDDGQLLLPSSTLKDKP